MTTRRNILAKWPKPALIDVYTKPKLKLAFAQCLIVALMNSKITDYRFVVISHIGGQINQTQAAGDKHTDITS